MTYLVLLSSNYPYLGKGTNNSFETNEQEVKVSCYNRIQDRPLDDPQVRRQPLERQLQDQWDPQQQRLHCYSNNTRLHNQMETQSCQKDQDWTYGRTRTLLRSWVEWMPWVHRATTFQLCVVDFFFFLFVLGPYNDCSKDLFDHELRFNAAMISGALVMCPHVDEKLLVLFDICIS